MKVAIFTLIFSLFFGVARSQSDCDIATNGVGIIVAPGSDPGKVCVGDLVHFQFALYNFGTDPGCAYPVGTITAVFDFPTLAGNVKPYIYEGPLSFTTGYFSWVYDPSEEVLIGTNIIPVTNGDGDYDIQIPVRAMVPGAGSSAINISQSYISDNTANNNGSAQLTILADPVLSCPGNTAVCITAPAFALTGATPSGGTYSGAGVSGGMFNPSAAGAGTHTITYSYFNGGCTATCTFAITVNPTLTAGVSIQSDDADNSICQGASVTFTATPVNGGTTPSYQWLLNGNPVGLNQPTYTTTTLVNGDDVSVVLTSNATPCGAGSPATSNTIETTVESGTSNTENVTACDAYTWAVNGQTYTVSGTYTVVSSCNTQTLNLTINNSTTGTTTITACDSYTWAGPLGNGTVYTASGTYTNVTTNGAGCPHTETLNLTINNSTSGTTNVTACDTYTWSGPLGNGITYTLSGTYTSVTTNGAGCPHTETLNLTINNSTSGTTTVTACDTYTWSGSLGNGNTYTVSGTYTSVTTNGAGCPHTETLNLTINNSTSGTTNVTACDTYTWSGPLGNGNTYTVSGTYTNITTNGAGCPHTETLILTINNSTTGTTTVTACDTYTWSGPLGNGNTYTVSGTYTSVTTNGAGCPHTETLNLTINNSTSGTTTATACDSYTWSGPLGNGTVYTASGTYTNVTTNGAGCPHTETLNLTINNSTSGTTTATACDTYTWSGPLGNGNTYMVSGTYTSVTTNGAGCPHTETLNLTINNSTSGTTTVTACDTYTWSGPLGDGNTYTVSGTYTSVTTNAAGCPHTETLNLTINNSTSGATNVTACDTYTWSGPLGNGNIYTISGTYTSVTTNGAGCPHTETLNLTINNSTSGTTNVTACDTYTWSGPFGNGNTYTISGTYTSVTTNGAGCPHTETLNLTINNSTSGTTTATACDSYTWAGPLGNGTVYTASGTYTNVTTNGAGCPHTETLNLTINNSTSGTTTVTGCDTYTWSGPLGDGNTYTVSGTYTSVTTNVAGCPHTETLNLTINNSTSGTTTVTACDTYTWSGPTGDGNTYTASGTYTSVTTNGAGCPHTETLNLTITASTTSSETAAACDTYTWAVNGQTYSTSGTYTSVSGCHTSTLNLTITNTPSTPVITGVYNGNGTYTLTASGYTGNLLWSTLETTPSIIVSATGTYTVTAAVGSCTSAPASYVVASSVSADPGLGITYLTDVADVPVNQNDLQTGTSYRIHVPLFNQNQDNIIPAHSTTLVIDLGDRLVLDGPLGNPLSAYFTWTSAVVGGHVIITGDQVNDIPADLSTVEAVFNVMTNNYCTSVIQTDWIVDNHASNPTLIDEEPLNNSSDVVYTSAIMLTATPVNVTCFGYANGNITVSSSAGTTIQITDAGNQVVTAPFAPGTYTVTATGVNDTPPGGVCSVSTTVTITEPALLTAGTSFTNVTCFNAANGTATAIPAGGTAPYTYLWNTTPAQTSQTASGLGAGTYTVTVTDANGCSVFTSATISQPASLSASATGTNVNCFGNSTGTATASVTGGTAPYTYVWSPSGGTDATATGLAADTYTVTVSDANGCTATASYTVTQPASGLNVIVSGTNVNCSGNSTGTATATVSGGTAGYSYSWNTTPVQTTAIATGLAAGTYTVTVTDAAGCTTSGSYTVTQPLPLSVITSFTNVTCFNAGNGTATATVSGGTGSYSYSWNTTPVQTTATASGLAPGSYTVTVTDGAGCISTGTVTISQPALLGSTGSVVNVTCNGAANGSATIIPSGGTAPYTYSWNTIPVQTTQTATGLAPGTYTATITDANGCTRQQAFTISQPSALTALATIVNVSCNGGTNGSAAVNVFGGTGPYTYSWNTTPVQTTATASGLSAGTYIVTVTDSKGCILTETYNISQPAALVATPSGSNTSCFGGTNGSAGVTVTGGTVPYSYSWNTTPVQTTALATGLGAGTYTVTVTDNKGCITTASYTVTSPAAISLSTSQTNVVCFGSSTGTATVTATGGTAPYGYSWNSSPVQTSQTATALPAGTYTVTVTDAAGCINTTSVTITQPAGGVTATASGTNITCFGAANGTATANPAGGTAPYTYSWNTTPVQTTQTATGLAPGLYSVTVTDAGGCTANASYTVTQPAAALTVAISNVTGNTCHSGSAGSLTATGNGGTSGYSYTISGPANTTGATSGIFTGLAAGTYTVTVTDANSCTVNSAPVTITQPAGLLPDLSLGSDYTANFFGSNGVTQTILYNVAEIGGNPAIGDTIRIIKLSGYVFGFNASSTSETIGTTTYALDNTNWKMDNSNPAFVSVIYDPMHNSTPGVINCGTLKRITITVTRNTPNIATFTLSARLRKCGTNPGNSETNLNNNLSSIIFTAE